MGGSTGKARVDFFVSYAGPDRPWAEWAAQQLERNNFSYAVSIAPPSP